VSREREKVLPIVQGMVRIPLGVRKRAGETMTKSMKKPVLEEEARRLKKHLHQNDYEEERCDRRRSE